MTQDVVKATLIPSITKATKKETVRVPVMTKRICCISSTPTPAAFDSGAHSGIAHVSGTHITDFLSVTGEMHSGKMTANGTSPMTLGLLEHDVRWLVAVGNSESGASHASGQSFKTIWSRRRHTSAEGAKSLRKQGNENRTRDAVQYK